RRVEIKSNTPELLFATTNTVYQNPLTVSPEQLEFEIECYNEANLKNVDSWKLTASQGNYNIAEFTGKDKQKQIDVIIDKNNARLLTGGKDLEISLSSYVKDKSNEEKLNVKVKKDTNNIEI